MEWPKVKIYLIIMLAVLNCFLAGVFFSRYSQAHAQERTAMDNALSVIHSNGMTVNAAVLGKAYDVIYTYEAKRNMSIESAVAKALTGSGEGEGENTISYDGPDGSAKFSGNGSFEIDLTNTAVTDNDTAALFELMGLDIGDSAVSLSTEDDGAVARLVQEADGIKIADCLTTVYYEGGKPFRIEGKRINGELFRTDAVYSRSVITAVMAFVDYVGRNNIECSEISDVELCYISNVPAPGFYRLTPNWEVRADSGVYRIDMLSGEVEYVD